MDARRRRPPESPDVADLAEVIAKHGEARVRQGLDAEGFGGVTAPEGRLLARLATGPSSVRALAETLGVTAQLVSKVTADLAERGYLTASPDPTDGRVRVLRLAPAGEAYLVARRKVRGAAAREQQRWLGTRDFVELMRLLEALAALYEGPAPRE